MTRKQRVTLNCLQCDHIFKSYTKTPKFCPLCHSDKWNLKKVTMDEVKDDLVVLAELLIKLIKKVS